MKPVSIAPAYVAFYPLLADIAREHGYSLCIHGSVASDMDLVAIPWVSTPKTPEILLEAFKGYCGQVMAMMFRGSVFIHGPEQKPHGRLAYTIQIGNGFVIDLSIMSFKQPLPDFDSLTETDKQKLAIMLINGTKEQRQEALSVLGFI